MIYFLVWDAMYSYDRAAQSKSAAAKEEYLVTGMAEYYIYVEASSKEEAVKLARKSKQWHRTMNAEMTDIKAQKK